MKKRLKITALLATITVIGILIFQTYWVYNTYKTGERNFNSTVLNALYKSIDLYPLSVSKLPENLTIKDPFLPITNLVRSRAQLVDTSDPATQSNTKKHSPPASASMIEAYVANGSALYHISNSNLFAVQQLVAQLLTRASGKPVKLDILSALFKKELQKKGIALPFKLLMLKPHEKPSPGQVTSPVPFSRNNDVVAVELTHTFQFLLAQNIIPAIVSLLLIILSGGSLIYMGLIINRQMQLDGLKNDFINNITHELRTPVSILRSSSESLLKFGDLKDTDKTIRHLNINLDILDKLDKNVDRILDISRYEHGIKSLNYELIQIDQLIENIINRFSVREDISIQYTSHLSSKLVSTDSYIIDTIVSNLLDNAIKYSKGQVNIHVITETRKGTGWQIQVIDNGIGISEQNIPYIFDKFYRVNSGNLHDVKGYGLGLSYIKQLINSLNGIISVKSRLATGTEFIIKFPDHE